MTRRSPEGAAVVLADPAGRIRYWSPGAEQRFGHPATAVLGRAGALQPGRAGAACLKVSLLVK
jgi:PAS domain-containing protein